MTISYIFYDTNWPQLFVIMQNKKNSWAYFYSDFPIVPEYRRPRLSAAGPRDGAFSPETSLVYLKYTSKLYNDN